MTDGETGERNYWILFQIQKFAQMPEFERVAAVQAYETSPDAPEMVQFRLADGRSADTIVWPNLGYADAYADSFEVFDQLQHEGTIAAGVRIQVQYPTPLASMAGTIVPEDMPAVAEAYEAALFADLDELLGRVPHDRIAVQWDVAVEFGLLEGAMGPAAMPLEQIVPGLVRCVDMVPDDMPVGMHLCYGDYGHQHFKQPESVRMQVDVVNAVNAAARGGRSPGRRSLFRRPATTPTTSRRSATCRPGCRRSSTSRSCRTTRTIKPRARPPHRRAHRRGAGRSPGGARLGDLHRVRHGTGGRRRHATPAGPPPPDPVHLMTPRRGDPDGGRRHRHLEPVRGLVQHPIDGLPGHAARQDPPRRRERHRCGSAPDRTRLAHAGAIGAFAAVGAIGVPLLGELLFTGPGVVARQSNQTPPPAPAPTIVVERVHHGDRVGHPLFRDTRPSIASGYRGTTRPRTPARGR